MSNQDAQAQASPIHQAGYIIDERFELLRVIGEGGMGSVFLARQLQVDRDVVVKVLKPELCNNDEQVERFKREATLACKLKHPNSVLTYDFGVDHGVPYIVMEYLEGSSLADILFQRKRLSVQETVNILTQVCRSLKEAHDKGMVHRDLKPENIHVLSEPERPNLVKVLDFGIAKLITSHPDASKSNLTKGDIIFGTPQYMAPEQIRGKDLDARADVYSLGVILYQCLTGRLPYDSQTVVDILTQHLTQPIPTPTLDDLPALSISSLRGLNRLLSRSMAKRPEDRISDVTELIAELEGLAALSTPAPETPSAPPPRPPSPRASHPPTGEPTHPQPPRRSRVRLLITLLLITSAVVLFNMPHLAPGGRGWAPWVKQQYAHYVAPLLSAESDRALTTGDAPASPLPMEEADSEVDTEISAFIAESEEANALLIGDDSRDVFKVDELVEEAQLSEEAQLIQEAQLIPKDPKAEEPKTEDPKAEEPKAEEPKAEEPKAEEPKAEEPKAEEPKAEEPKAEEPKAEEPKHWTLIVKSTSQEEVQVFILKDKIKRPLKRFKVSQGAPKALRVHPQHAYKVICKAHRQPPKGVKVMGRSGEVKRVTCF